MALRPVLPDGTHTFGARKPIRRTETAPLLSPPAKKQGNSARMPVLKFRWFLTDFPGRKKGYMAIGGYPGRQNGFLKKPVSASKMSKPSKPITRFAANDIHMAKQMGIDVNGFQ